MLCIYNSLPVLSSAALFETPIVMQEKDYADKRSSVLWKLPSYWPIALHPLSLASDRHSCSFFTDVTLSIEVIGASAGTRCKSFVRFEMHAGLF